MQENSQIVHWMKELITNWLPVATHIIHFLEIEDNILKNLKYEPQRIVNEVESEAIKQNFI